MKKNNKKEDYDYQDAMDYFREEEPVANDHRVLFEENSEAANQSLADLVSKRESIANKLEELQTAIEDFLGSESIKSDVFDFLELQTLDAVKAEIAKRWIKKENVTLPIDPLKAFSVMVLTTEIKNVIAAWEEVNGASEKPTKYWSDAKMSFRTVPVSEAEKERIKEQHRTYVESEEVLEVMETLKKEVAVINFANTRLGMDYTERTIHSCKPHLFNLVKRKSNNYRPPHIFEFELDLSKFLIVPVVESVFDQ